MAPEPFEAQSDHSLGRKLSQSADGHRWLGGFNLALCASRGRFRPPKGLNASAVDTAIGDDGYMHACVSYNHTTPCIKHYCRSKDATFGAPGLATRNKKLPTGLLASLRTERSDASISCWRIDESPTATAPKLCAVVVVMLLRCH